MLIDMLKNRSNYHVTQNALARILQLKNVKKMQRKKYLKCFKKKDVNMLKNSEDADFTCMKKMTS